MAAVIVDGGAGSPAIGADVYVARAAEKAYHVLLSGGSALDAGMCMQLIKEFGCCVITIIMVYSHKGTLA